MSGLFHILTHVSVISFQLSNSTVFYLLTVATYCHYCVSPCCHTLVFFIAKKVSIFVPNILILTVILTTP